MGHLYPYFFGFKGGKGVATALGAIFALSPSVGICALAAWGITAYLFRYSSLAALVATALIPLFIWLLADRGYMIPITVLCVFIFIRHYENIRRLIAGTETKLGQKKVE
jgi:glycerol-3-phosphate acyltransferase PlsY